MKFLTDKSDIRYGYIRQYGEIYWVGDYTINPVPVKGLTFLIDREEKMLLKHGSKELVEKRYNELLKAYANTENWVEFMLLTLPDDVDLTEINKCIENSTYIDHFLKMLNIGEDKKL